MIGRLTILAFMLGYCGMVEAYGPLRCEGRIIDPGMSIALVQALCGQPKSRFVEEVPVRHRVKSGFSRFAGITIDETWVYDRGWGRFPAILLFQNGMLKRIDYARYRSGSR